ncbi:hypothetical protein [Fluviicola taffensis]|uniref:Uncharacterized protein n=1 Tax=Fluviicola taffensis (strain DSM 16823 / NCIMB 13979 / RW262) TaxID=755732 RepID=F2IIZ3_FLUTR|nr:hypothetical protein [Fluviicola taffensis]AEA43851.1 hypothetical protein Fluta_1864 [Fluviicola taffensis DSM 16823]
MKKLLYIFICCLLVLRCTKENGKKPYDFALVFESGDEWHYQYKMYEKYRKDHYDDEDLAQDVTLKHGRAIYLENDKVLIKTESKKLMGSFLIEKTQTTLFSANQTGSFEGFLTVGGSYEKKGRKFIVEDGKFEFLWTNAEVYGMQDTVLKGKWTLKRK